MIKAKVMYEVGEYIHDKLSKAYQNSASEANRLLLEYMKKKGLTIADLEGNVAVQYHPFGVEKDDCAVLRYWYKGELILSMKQRIYQVSPLEIKAEMVIEKGDW